VSRSTAQLGQRECTVHQANAALPSLLAQPSTSTLGHTSVHPGTSQSCIRIRIGWYSIHCRLGNGGHDDTGACVVTAHTARASLRADRTDRSMVQPSGESMADEVDTVAQVQAPYRSFARRSADDLLRDESGNPRSVGWSCAPASVSDHGSRCADPTRARAQPASCSLVL
jgi:hypothetical protein